MNTSLQNERHEQFRTVQKPIKTTEQENTLTVKKSDKSRNEEWTDNT